MEVHQLQHLFSYLDNDAATTLLRYAHKKASLYLIPFLSCLLGELVGVVDTVGALQIRPPVVTLDMAEELQPEGTPLEPPEGTFSMTFFWVLMLVASMLGFLINVSVILLVKHTSPLTSVIVGTTKVHCPTALLYVQVLIAG